MTNTHMFMLGIYCIFQESDHNHSEDNEMIMTNEISIQLKQTVENDPTKPIRRVYNEVLQFNGDAARDEVLPEFATVRTRMQRVRRSLMPIIPTDVDDVDIRDDWARTWKGDRFLLFQDNNWGIAVFATRANLRKLQQCDTIYIDGTFKTCPRPYYQFVTVHGMFHGRVLPFAMCLLTGKEVGQYRQILQHLKHHVRAASGHRFRPAKIVTDFERSLLLAIETELPNCRICGCYFHFTRNLWKKIQELGLAGPYGRRRHLRKCIRKFMAIGYLPLALVRQNFRLHATAPATLRKVRRYPALQDFINYIQRNYLDGAQYPATMWNVYGRTSDNRTNNHVEGTST